MDTYQTVPAVNDNVEQTFLNKTFRGNPWRVVVKVTKDREVAFSNSQLAKLELLFF